MSEHKGWVGVDLDGTLAVYDHWRGIKHIGKPIPPTVELIRDLLREGVEVRIFTARVQEGEDAIRMIEYWCEMHIGAVLPVTDRKDFSMVYMVDDRAVTVEKNTGKVLTPIPSIQSIKDHWNVKKGAPNPEEFKHDAAV